MSYWFFVFGHRLVITADNKFLQYTYQCSKLFLMIMRHLAPFLEARVNIFVIFKRSSFTKKGLYVKGILFFPIIKHQRMTGIKVCGDEVSSIYGNYVPCRTFYIPITVPSNMHIWLIVFKKNIYIAVELGRLIFRRLMKRIKHTKNLFTVTFIHRLIFFPLRPDRISAGLWSIYIDEFYSSYTKSRATF